MEASADAQAPMDAAAEAPSEELPSGEGPEPEICSAVTEDEALLSSARRLISKITATQDNPNPWHLHALASILEKQESRYMRDSGISSSARSSHVIGRLGNLIRYPLVFDDDVLENLKSWVMEDSLEDSADVSKWKRDLQKNKPTEFEMLKTYASGLLALSLAGGVQVVEDILSSGLSAKLMRYLRIRILGESNSILKDTTLQSDAKHPSVPASTRSKEENRGRSRQVLDGLRVVDEGLTGDQNAERDREKNICLRLAHEEECYRDGESLRSELITSSTDRVDIHDMGLEDDDVADDVWCSRDLPGGKLKFVERHTARSAYEDADQSARDDSIRRRVNRGWPRSRGKGRTPEGTLEIDRLLLSSASGLRLGDTTRSSRDRNLCKTEDAQRVFDARNNLIGIEADLSSIEGDRFTECLVGTQDISEFVKKAIKAAEAEAKAANAPIEAIKAAGDAAAELVKSSAVEVWMNTNEEEAAVQAASKAASTVVDAAITTKVTRSSRGTNDDLVELKDAKLEGEDEFEEFFILDSASLAQLREKYCILCLEILGEYVEALGPVLHEKGVDVCLELLERHSVKGEAAAAEPEILALLPEVLKLICALAAHKKFSALFVDRRGMQKLLSVPRDSHSFVGLSSCLFTIGSLQGVMERVCALPSETVYQVVELALKLLECSHEVARKNAAIFFSGAFVFRAILDSFDAQDGMHKMLYLLQKCSEVLSTQEKAIAYHTCVSLRQYFRSHLLLLVDSLRPNKSSRNVARGTSSGRAAYKPLDISNEAMEVLFRQIQRERKLGSAFVRASWPVMDKFLASNGHITMLELFQALTLERYLHDLAPYALGVLHIVTLVPCGRKLIINATLSNDRLGMAIILDAANGAGYVDPEVIHPALSVLVNLVCPPPAISNKTSVHVSSQPSASINNVSASASENRERHTERNMVERNVSLSFPTEFRESNLLEKGTGTVPCSSQTTVPAMPSGVVGDRRICLGPGAGCAGLAAQLEQGYYQARVALRANNGIKILLHLLHPRMITPPQALDCIRALVCRVLLGLARDETIAHILTKLQVGKKLSELIRDLGSQSSANEQNRWQTELIQVALELIAIVTNSERASTIVATDAAAPTLRRIERAAVAAATPITYHPRELLLLIHEHLIGSGLTAAAAALQKEADLTPLPSLTAVTPSLHQIPFQETSAVQVNWPFGRSPSGFLLDVSKSVARDDYTGLKSDLSQSSSGKKPLVFASSLSMGKKQPLLNSSSINGLPGSLKNPSAHNELDISQSGTTSNVDADTAAKAPAHFMKRKLFDPKDASFSSPAAKRLNVGEFSSPPSLFQTSSFGRKGCLAMDGTNLSHTGNLTTRYPAVRSNASSIPVDNSDDTHLVTVSGASTAHLPLAGLPGEVLSGNTERMTLDSVIVQYLKHQHRQCSTPITTLPPLSLLHPHVCPEPSRRLNALANVTERITTREVGRQHCGIYTGHRDHQFVHSRFRPCRTCRDDASLLTSITFLGNSHSIATGSHSGELRVFDTNDGNVVENYSSHQTPILMVQSASSGDTPLILSSGSSDVKLWGASAVSNGPLHSVDGCKFARFSHSGTTFAALSADASARELLLYDIQTCNLELKLPDSLSNSSGLVRGHTQSLIHFSPLDTMLLWNGVLWDRRSASPLHQFDQFTDYGGGGFHPSGNETKPAKREGGYAASAGKYCRRRISRETVNKQEEKQEHEADSDRLLRKRIEAIKRERGGSQRRREEDLVVRRERRSVANLVRGGRRTPSCSVEDDGQQLDALGLKLRGMEMDGVEGLLRTVIINSEVWISGSSSCCEACLL
ncbi:hypothetical protein KSP40_PGU006263 [Platanthera guangdongensis]|uniref:Uncharacterized protein n=1 Tax=Platanthera guangdongensis TaxID=2320717 RepID=A0ABR2M8F5_9ASPA